MDAPHGTTADQWPCVQPQTGRDTSLQENIQEILQGSVCISTAPWSTGSVGQAGHCSQKWFHNTREKSVESENKCEGKGRTKNNCSSVGSWTQTGPEGRTVPQSTQLSQGHPQLALGPAAPAGEEQSGLEAKKLPDVSCGSVQIIFGPCREVSGPKDALFLCTLCGCRTCLDGVCWHWQRGPGT